MNSVLKFVGKTVVGIYLFIMLMVVGFVLCVNLLVNILS